MNPEEPPGRGLTRIHEQATRIHEPKEQLESTSDMRETQSLLIKKVILNTKDIRAYL